MNVYIFGCNSTQYYDGGTAVVVAENFRQAKELLAEREIPSYYYDLRDEIPVEEAMKTPQVLGAFFHIE